MPLTNPKTIGTRGQLLCTLNNSLSRDTAFRDGFFSYTLAICQGYGVAVIVIQRRTESSNVPGATHSSIAQLAEHSTVNRRVTGSSPVGGAGWPQTLRCLRLLRVLAMLRSRVCWQRHDLSLLTRGHTDSMIQFVVGAAAGYVFGTKAGRKRYHQIKDGYEKLANSRATKSVIHGARKAVAQRLDPEPRMKEVKDVSRRDFSANPKDYTIYEPDSD